MAEIASTEGDRARGRQAGGKATMQKEMTYNSYVYFLCIVVIVRLTKEASILFNRCQNEMRTEQLLRFYTKQV